MSQTAQQIIRESCKAQQNGKWGFLIYRCTYASTSQDRWDKFLVLIKEDARDYLKNSEDQDLWDSIDWTVIEDEKLDGVHWKEARDKFDAWVRTELADIEDTPCRPWVEQEADYGAKFWTHKMKFEWRTMREPRHGFFLYVDEAAVRSVLDHAEDKEHPGGYFITLAQNGMVDLGEEDFPELAEEKEPDETEEEYWRDHRQKFRAGDLVSLYATVVDGGWPDDFHEGDDGISEIVSI